MQLEEYLHFAFALLDKTGPLILKRLQEGVEAEMKTDKTIVTAIDREVETLMRAEILKLYPDHGIIGEEFGSLAEGADYVWLIDPIDGTEALVDGTKSWGTLLALQHRGETLLGVIDHPYHGLRYYGWKGGGSYRNGVRLSLQACSKPEDTTIAICRKDQFERHGALKEYAQLMALPNVKEISDCYGHTRVLEGEIGAMIDYNLSLWDIVATKLLMEEAGGKFIVQAQKKTQLGKTVYGILFGKPDVVDWLSGMF